MRLLTKPGHPWNRSRATHQAASGGLLAFMLGACLAPSVGRAVDIPVLETFESSLLLQDWELTGTGDYFGRVTYEHLPNDGLYHVVLDDKQADGSFSRNELTVTLDLKGEQDLRLVFWARKLGGVDHEPPPSPFAGGADFDGVAVSNDGGSTWTEIQDLRGSLTTTYKRFEVDLDAAVAGASLAYTDGFKIRFNQFDDGEAPDVGIALDNIAVVRAGAPVIEAVPARIAVEVPEGLDRLGTTFEVRNTGNGILTYIVESDAAWATPWPDYGQTAGEEKKVGIEIKSSRLAPGEHTAKLTVRAAGATVPPAAVDLTLTVVPAPTSAPLPLFETFESGRLGPFWSTRSTETGRARLLTQFEPNNGQYHLVMDDTLSGGAFSRNEATLSLDLEGRSNVWISFQAKSLGDEPHAPASDPFTDGADFDGVAVSDDGGQTWHEIVPLRDLEPETWQFFAANLDEFAAQRGLVYSDAFLVRFNQYDDGTAPSDGLAFDDIVIDEFDMPFMKVEPAVLTPSAREAEDAPQGRFTITNIGAGTLDYSITVDRPWLRVDPPSGSSSGEEDEIAVIYSTAGLQETSYNARITITDPDSFQGRQTLDVLLTIDLRPEIHADKSSFSVSVEQGQNAPSDQFRIRNSGDAFLRYTVTTDVDWLVVAPDSGVSSGQYNIVGVTYRLTELDRGIHTGNITIEDPNALNSPYVIPVTARVEADNFIEILSVGRYPDAVFPEVALRALIDTVPGRSCQLVPADFTITEEGLPAMVQSVECSGTAGDTKVDLVFVFDDTQSMWQEIEGMQAETRQFAEELLALGLDVRFGLVTYKDTVEFDMDLSGNIELLQEAVDRLVAAGGGDPSESVLDAVVFGLNTMSFRPDARKVFVVITDATAHVLNDGTTFSSLTMAQAVAICRQGDATVFSVSPNFQSATKGVDNEGEPYDPRKSSVDDVRGMDARTLAEGTGGLWINLREGSFDRVADWVRDVITSVHTVTYLSPNPVRDGRTRTVCVDMIDPVKGPALSCDSYRVPSATQGAIALSTDFLRPRVLRGTNPANDSFTVRNGLGSGTLNYSITSDRPWVSVSPQSGSVQAEENEVQVIYNMGARTETDYDTFATITVKDLFSVNSSQSIFVFPEDLYPNPDHLMVLTSFTDMWISVNTGGLFATPFRMSWLGFQHQQESRWKTLVGDFNGNGSVDAATVTDLGQLWVATSNQDFIFEAPAKVSEGWLFRPADGWDVLSGDFDGNGHHDLLQVEPGQYSIHWNGPGTLFGAGVLTSALPFGLSPDGGLWLATADVDGDGRDDLVQIDSGARELRVMLGSAAGFSAPVAWGGGDFLHDPQGRGAILFGDFNGDGLLDVCQPDRSPVLAAMGGSAAPLRLGPWTEWSGGLGFHNDPARGGGWWIFAADVNGDGFDDLVQVTEFGDVWMALSNGVDAFGPSTFNAAVGFHHRPEGPWQMYVHPNN